MDFFTQFILHSIPTISVSVCSSKVLTLIKSIKGKVKPKSVSDEGQLIEEVLTLIDTHLDKGKAKIDMDLELENKENQCLNVGSVKEILKKKER